MENLFALLQNIPSVADELKFFLSNKEDIDYDSFTMSKEHFLDIYETRLESNNERGIVIKGLKETVISIRNIEIAELCSHSLTIDKKNVLIYTDPMLSQLLGIIYTYEVTFKE